MERNRCRRLPVVYVLSEATSSDLVKVAEHKKNNGSKFMFILIMDHYKLATLKEAGSHRPRQINHV